MGLVAVGFGGGGLLTFNTPDGIGKSFTILYSLANDYTFSGAGHPLFADLFSYLQGTYDIAVTYGNGTLFETVVQSYNTPGVETINSSSFSNDTVKDSVDSISLTVTRTGPPSGFKSASRAVLHGSGASISADTSAVPEPGSMALLGFTALGGWYASRRRRNKTEVTA